jgi:acylphosphatase
VSVSGDVEARGYVVRGRVQGVGFRWFTQRAGIRLGLAGHVWNRADGGVEVHARGTAVALEAFEAALRQGAASSRVDSVFRVPADPRTPESGFLVEAW